MLKQLRYVILILLVAGQAMAQENTIPGEGKMEKMIDFTQDVRTESGRKVAANRLALSDKAAGQFTSEVIAVGITNAKPFITLAATLWGTGLEDYTLKFEYQHAENGEWSDWKEAGFDGHADGDEGGKLVTQLQYLDPTTEEVRFRITLLAFGDMNPVLEKMQFNLYSPGEQEEDFKKAESPRGQRTSATCPKPATVSRSGWGARAPRSGYSYTNVTHLVIHHEGGGASPYRSNWAAVVRSIQNYHMDNNGWSDIGYNFLAAPDGTLYEGRGENVIGAHFCGENSYTMAVCYMGDYSIYSPAAAGMRAIEDLFAWKASKNGINPTGSSYHYSVGGSLANVCGHRDNDGCTTCPGGNLYAYMSTIRNNIQSIINNGCNSNDTQAPTTNISTSATSPTDDFTVTFSDNDNVGVTDRFYQVLEWRNNEWRGNRGNGFYNDNFGDQSIFSDYTIGDASDPTSDWRGTWTETSDGRLRQSNTTATNTGITTFLSQTALKPYLYNFAARVVSTSGPQKFGMHIMSSSNTHRERGVGYLVWFNMSTQEVLIYKTSNVSPELTFVKKETISVTETNWNDYKIYFDPISGNLRVYINNGVVLNWTDSSPVQTGNYISLRTGEASVEFDDLKVFKWRSSGNVMVTVSNFAAGNYGGDARFAPPNSTDPSCKVKSYVKDGADNWSNFGNLDVRVTPCATCKMGDEVSERVELMPNPVKGHSSIHYVLADRSKVSIRITDTNGRRLATVREETQEGGRHAVEIGGYFDKLAAGTYLIQIETSNGYRVIRAVKR
ncbi:N-acetylmuramoyl-L-alanine amidase [Roseivirga sp. BDSF3-8]|uniref:N-acetylmuramoyl-L-alanine amidase n=1 Tax=Roseivirga sp. BDSF3-8 TaxID=3241598 RepID=UPI003531E321